MLFRSTGGCRGNFWQLLATGVHDGAGIQSLRIPAGYSLQLYQAANGSGQTICLSWTVADISQYRWPDGAAVSAIGSLEAFGNPACLPASNIPPFSLEYTRTDPEQPGLVQALARWSGMDAVGHSLAWGDGSSTPLAGVSGTITLTHTYAPGHYTMTLRLHSSDFGQLNDAEPVHIRAACTDLAEAAVGLFSQRNCSGMAQNLPGTGWYELAELAGTVESVYLPNDYSVLLYREPFLVGTGYCLTATAPDLAQLIWPDGANLANAVYSLQVFANNSCQDTALALAVTPDWLAPGSVSAEVSWTGGAGPHLLLWGDGATTMLTGATGSGLFTHEYAQLGIWTAYLVIVDPAGFQHIQAVTFPVQERYQQFLPLLLRAG